MKRRDILEIWKGRIKNEARHGDRTKACNDTGTTMTTFQTALRKETVSNLSDKETAVLKRLIEILNARKEEISKLQLQPHYAV
jgi:hypothetical protein